jgi:hypothetical protein
MSTSRSARTPPRSPAASASSTLCITSPLSLTPRATCPPRRAARCERRGAGGPAQHCLQGQACKLGLCPHFRHGWPLVIALGPWTAPWSFGLRPGPLDCALGLWTAPWAFGLRPGPLDCVLGLWTASWALGLRPGPVDCPLISTLPCPCPPALARPRARPLRSSPRRCCPRRRSRAATACASSGSPSSSASCSARQL